MNNSFKFSAAFKLVLMAGMVSTLAACGGGGSTPPVANTPPPVVSYALTVTGNAATGAAMANATVSAVCKAGTATTATGADGAYTLKVTAPGEGPCILSIAQNGVTLRSIAAGDGARANITPLTEMLVSYISVSAGAGASATPAQLVANANFKTIVTNATMLSASVNDLVEIISVAAGGAVTVPTDFLSATLVPKSATNAGNAQDAVLEALKAAKVVGADGAPPAWVVDKVRERAGKNIVTGGRGG